MNSWKEQFDKEFADRKVDTAMAVERDVEFSRFMMYHELKTFISTEIVEKLIRDAKHHSSEGLVGGDLEEQLGKDWL